MNNLCIIITGLVRTFFNKGLISFMNMIEVSKKKYKKIHIIIIISGNFSKENINFFIEKLNSINITCDKYIYEDYNILSNNYNKNRIKLEKYIELKNNYMKQNNNAHNEIFDPDEYISSRTIQFHQLEIGIEKLIKYELINDINFDVIMRTRFDVLYDKLFYPHIHSSDSNLVDKILLNENIKNIFKNTFKVDVLSENYISYLKNNKIELPECRVKIRDISLGSAYFNNYISIQNIKKGNNDILYCFNDYYFFGKKDVFLKLKNFFNEYGLLDTNLNIPHFYAPESQLLIYCFNKNINPIMYLNNESIIRY